MSILVVETYRRTRSIYQQSCDWSAHEHGKGCERADPGDVKFGAASQLVQVVVLLKNAKSVDKAYGTKDGKGGAEDGEPGSGPRMC